MATGKGKSIVAVVDDDAGMRKAIGSLLKTAGFETSVYASAEGFLRAPQGRKAGCLVLDLRLPGMSGIELYSTLRKQGFAAPTVLVTGERDERGDLRARALSAGIQAVLHKPFDADALLQFVQQAFEKKSS